MAMIMNSIETDLRRALLSVRFLLAVCLQLAVLWSQGFQSTLYKMSVPLACALPYACGWLEEYQSGYVRLALVRTSFRAYISGKFLACGISGGAAEGLAAWLYMGLHEQAPKIDLGLVFVSAMLWAEVSALMAALSNSRYLAYGGAFVIFYFMVILHERYWQRLYCLNPYEWLAPEHSWVLGNTGILLMLSGLILVLALWYASILSRRIEYD